MITEEIIEKILSIHNEYRKKHNSDGLIYSIEIGIIAQSHAENLANSSMMVHSNNKYSNEPLGENIARLWYSENLNDNQNTLEDYMIEAVNSWYYEVNDYDFTLNEFQPKAGHFSQLVWKNSKYLGFGIAKSNDGKYYAVANYFPAGNYSNEYINNVASSIDSD